MIGSKTALPSTASNRRFQFFLSDDFSLSERAQGALFSFLKGEVGALGELQLSEMCFNVEGRVLEHVMFSYKLYWIY